MRRDATDATVFVALLKRVINEEPLCYVVMLLRNSCIAVAMVGVEQRQIIR